MTLAQLGNKVSVAYTGRLNDGTIFDSSVSRPPLEFTLGAGEVIPGFDNAVLGMEVGESTTLHISPSEGYGAHDDNLVITFPRTQMPADMQVAVGDRLQMKNDQGTVFPVLVTGVTDDDVTIDANHPLAGKTLTFEITLLAIAS